MLQDNLKNIREEKGYSKLKLASICGVSRRTIMLIETGRRLNPGVETLNKLSHALNVSIDDLIK